MPTESHTTAPNLHIDAANGVTYRYRRFGTPPAPACPWSFCSTTAAPPLASFDPATLHGGGAEGYTDYPAISG
jgi:hypothetical protein